MIFRKPQKQIKLPIVKINGIQIECIDNFNFLGVIIDKNLTWKNHLNKVSNKKSQNNRYNEQTKIHPSSKYSH